MLSPCVDKPLGTSHYTDREKMIMGVYLAHLHIGVHCIYVSELITLAQRERNVQFDLPRHMPLQETWYSDMITVNGSTCCFIECIVISIIIIIFSYQTYLL